MASPYTIDQLNGNSVPTGGQIPVTVGKDGTPQSPADIFNNNLMQILQSATVASNKTNQGLAQQKQNLQQEAATQSDLNGEFGDKSMFNGAAGPARLAVSQELEKSYDPGILSATNQQAVNNQSLANATGDINATIAAEKPVATGLSDNLTTPGGSTVNQGFNPTIDPETGLPYGYSGNNSKQNNNGSSGPTIVNGVDFGDNRSSGGLGAYSATQDPKEYAQSVSTSVNAIKELAAGQPITAATIDQYIQNNAGGKSPVTGQMVMNAAQQYGIDPSTLAGVLSHESTFGTAGKAVDNNNPGNQMPGGVEAKYPTMQQGVNATAKNLANRMQSNGSITASGSSGGSPLATSNASSIDAIKKQLPITVQNGVRASNSGIPYINLGEINPSQQETATVQAAKLGIKAFSGDEAAGIQALDTVSQSLNAMTVLAQQQLYPADFGVGTAANFVKNGIGSLAGTNSKLSDFSLNKDSAIKAVTALAGGVGSGLKLNTSTIEAAVNNLPTKYDSREVALEKIDKTRDLLNIQLSTAFGNPAIANGVTQYNGHTYNAGDTVVGAGGKIGVVQADGTITPSTS